MTKLKNQNYEMKRKEKKLARIKDLKVTKLRNLKKNKNSEKPKYSSPEKEKKNWTKCLLIRTTGHLNNG